jgi:MMP 1-O-methyltransferase
MTGNFPASEYLRRLLHAAPIAARQFYRMRYGPIGRYVSDTARIPSWLGRDEGLALARACDQLPPHAIIVEIGSVLGKSAILMAGACKMRGSGHVHCVDPFDTSGDAFSAPVYRAIAAGGAHSLRQRFDTNIARANLREWIAVHEGTAASVAERWTAPVDLLFLDGDQSRTGAREAYDRWMPFLKPGGTIALHNSTAREYALDHDGMYLVATELVRPPLFGDIRQVETTTLARKL